MINDIVSVSIIAITAYFMVYGFYAVFTDILKGKKK
jgi:hypothetical protein